MKKKKQTITTPSLSRQGMINKLLCVLVALLLRSVEVWADNVNYMQYDVANDAFSSVTVNATAISNSITSLGSAGNNTYYYVNGNITCTRITVNGNVHLILVDGKTLTVNDGIYVPNGSSLTIYGQSGNTGTLTATGSTQGHSGIGGKEHEESSSGNITINGGTINATGWNGGAGIGTGHNGNASGLTIIINGGIITATGGPCGGSGAGAGIGSGYNRDNGTIIIRGGKITANGATASNQWSAGIGAGSHASGGGNAGNITITGGQITATGGGNNSGIGCGSGGSSGTISLSCSRADDYIYSKGYTGTTSVANGKELFVFNGTTLEKVVSGSNPNSIGGKTLRMANYCGASGENGKNVVWYLTKDTKTTLHIEKNPGVTSSTTGAFDMKNYGNNSVGNFAPWIQPNGGNSASTGFKYGITEVTIGSGVTSIGDGAFENCSDLSSVSIYTTTPPAIGSNAFNGNAVGRMIYVPSESLNTYKTAWSSYADQITILEKTWPLTLEAMAAGTITFRNRAVNAIHYKINGGEEQQIPVTASNGTGTAINVSAGDIVTFYGSNSTYSTNGTPSTTSKISCTADCYVYGNIMSLINGDSFATNVTLSNNSNFYQLFYQNTHIRNHSSKKLVLPATTLKNNCYQSMFYGCTGLTSAPELPATTLANYCYHYMFSGCTGLTSAPELSASTLADYCYQGMFSGCTGLTSAPELPATTMKQYCYASMFYGCTGLTSAPELPATTLADHCYYMMFWDCTGLASAPELPATTLADYCYVSMFSGCTGLTSATELPATELANFCYSNMFYGCTGLTSAPELPATTLAYSCYSDMFHGCENLNKVICLATNIDATNCTNSWLNGVAATGTFIKAAGVSDWGPGVSGIPSGWTVVNIVNNWNDLKSAMSVSNNIVLVGNCTDPDPSETSYLEVNEGSTVNLDLNGYTIDHGLTSATGDGCVIVVDNGAALTITDNSTGKTGKITGGKNNNNGTNYYKGGGIHNKGSLTINGGSIEYNTDAGYGGGVYNQGTLSIHGGNIKNNSASKGGGIYNSNYLTITGGTITNNNSNSDGGGIYHGGYYFYLSGNPTISNNTKNGSAANNVFLYVPIQITGTLSNTIPIGITMSSPDVFTNGLSGKGNATNFSSDNANNAVVLNASNEARLSRILNSSNVSVPNATYNESSQTAVVIFNTNTTLEKGTDYAVTGTDSRTDAGTTESFTITGTGDYTGTVSGLTFTITPKSVTIPTAVTGLMWTGVAQTGVASGDGYTVTNGTATDIGNYTATATLNNTTNYRWSDVTTADKEIPWTIGAMLFEAGATSDWRTWYNNADMTVDTEKMETYVVTSVTSSEVTASSTDGKIYKNKPMLLKRKEGVTDAISVNASETALTVPEGLSTSDAYIGNVSSFANYTDGTVYVLAGSEFVRAKVTSTTTFDKSKCFIYLTPGNANSRLIIIGDGPTGINSVVTDEGNDTWYTIGGRKLSKQPKQPGVYISNGKKVIVK